jgi:hypothetical protein
MAKPFRETFASSTVSGTCANAWTSTGERIQEMKNERKEWIKVGE